MNITKAAALGSAILAPGLLLAACSQVARVAPATAPPPAPAATVATTPGPTLTPTSNSAAGALGTTFTVTTQNNDNGQSASYDVTAVKVDQHSALTQYDSLNNPADHLAAVEFRITGVTGQSSDDANSDATAISSDTTQYQSQFHQTPDGGDFNSGVFTVAPGQTVSGWVTFELPPGQMVASVEWAPGFSGGASGTWTV